MSEKYQSRSESNGEKQEQLSSAEHQEALANIEKRAEIAQRSHEEHERHAREEVEKYSKDKTSTEKVVKSGEDEEPHYSHLWHIKDLKAQAFNQTMARTRRHLSKPERKLSKLIHRPNVERISDMGAKTVARPSGVLVGGIVSLIGTVVVVYISKNLGTPIPKTMFVALFIAGFMVGLFLELIIRALRIKSHKT